jgi:ferritin
MASWAEINGYPGTSTFLYAHSDEERQHMLKLIRFVNDRGGKAIIPSVNQPEKDFKNLQNIFNLLLSHENNVTAAINNVVDVCLKEKDYTTHNFMQWYVSEQIEEETLAHHIIDQLNLIGNDRSALYFFDRDVAALKGAQAKADAGGK